MHKSNTDINSIQPVPTFDEDAPHADCLDEPDALERHYSLHEVAKLWGISREYARRLFRGRPGVLHLRKPGLSKRRAYITLRIPASVLREVHREMRQAKDAAVKRPDAEATPRRQKWLAGMRRRRVRSVAETASGQEPRA